MGNKREKPQNVCFCPRPQDWEFGEDFPCIHNRMWLAREPGVGSREKEIGEQGLS
jgi:hypothetical protein